MLIKNGFYLNFHNTGVDLFLETNYYGSGYWDNGFIVFDLVSNNNVGFSLMTSFSSSSDNDVNVWHSRLGHIGQQRMNRLAKEGLLGPLKKVNLPTCPNCLEEKMKRKPFGKAIRAQIPLQLVHSDVCGPMNVRAKHGASYFITFINDFTRFDYVYLISYKSEALGCFKNFLNLVENQKDVRLKALRTNRGREYFSN